MKTTKEKIIKYILFAFGSISIFVTVGIFLILIYESLGFFKQIPITEFLFSRQWTPLLNPKHYGILPLLSGTFLIVVLSSFISIPIGLLSAIYLSEYADKRVRKVVKPLLEILAGIPSIVYGFFALSTITPILQNIFSKTSIYNALSAAIAVGVMTLPMVASLSEDSMQAVPNSLREAAYGLGLTKQETVKGVVLPAAISGIISSFILAISRAIGETMIVALAAGSNPKLTLNPLESIQTMTGFIAQVSQGDIAQGSIESQTLYVVGLVLFLLTLGMNIFARYITNKIREEY